MFNRSNAHLAFMALSNTNGYEDATCSESDLVVFWILAATCRVGSRWLERYCKATNQPLTWLERSLRRVWGINASFQTGGTRHIKLCLELVDGGIAQGDLQSTELCDSDTPCGCRCKPRRCRGLSAHFQTLGQDLKLVFKDGSWRSDSYTWKLWRYWKT